MCVREIDPEIESVSGCLRGEGMWRSIFCGTHSPPAALTPVFLHPWVPECPRISSLPNVLPDHLIGLRV